MRIHNKLEIKTKDKVYVSYNNLLLPFAEALSLGEGYSKYLAIGTGVTQEDVSYLAKFESVVELVSEAHNFNPLNGQLFSRKKWVLEESDETPYEIVEVGLTANIEKDNPRIANRFLVNGGDPIYRDAGEEMTFEITIYLDFEDSSNLKLTAGENGLVKFILGEGKNGEFYVARGYDDTDNEIIIERNGVGVQKVAVVPIALVEDNPPRVSFYFTGELEAGAINEFLLFIGDEVVARQNVQNVHGGTSNVVVELTGDENCMLTLQTPDIKEIVRVTNKTTNEEVTDFTTSYYGTSFQGGLEQIFHDLGLPTGAKVVDSKLQDRLAFVVGNVVRIFKLDETGATELVATKIDASDGYLFLMFEDMFFVKCHHPDDTYSLRYYHLSSKTGQYEPCRYNLSYPVYDGIETDDFWHDMDAYYLESTATLRDFMFMIVSPNYLFGFVSKRSSIYMLYSNEVTLASGYDVRTIATSNPTNKYQNIFAGHAAKRDKMIYRKGGAYIVSDSDWAASIVRDYVDKGYPKLAKNHVYAVDDEIGAIKLYSLDSLSEHSIIFEGAEKIYVDNCLDYAVVKYSSGVVKVYFIDASRNLYEFSSPITNLESEIESFYVVGDYLVFKLVSGNFFRIKIEKNKMILSKIETGNVAEVEFTADLTPGQDGREVKFSASINVSAENE